MFCRYLYLWQSRTITHRKVTSTRHKLNAQICRWTKGDLIPIVQNLFLKLLKSSGFINKNKNKKDSAKTLTPEKLWKVVLTFIHTSRTKGYALNFRVSRPLNCATAPVLLNSQLGSPFLKRHKPKIFRTPSLGHEENPWRNNLSLQGRKSNSNPFLNESQL